jgi:hypothetical protein
MEDPKVRVWIGDDDIIYGKIVGFLDGKDIHDSTAQLTKATVTVNAKGKPSLIAIDVSGVKGLTKEARAAAAEDFQSNHQADGGGVVLYGLNSVMTATIRLLSFIIPRMRITMYVSTKEQAVEYLLGLAKKK